MSIKFDFKEDVFSLDKLLLPSRYYYFNEDENYIKLLNIGEGIFPKDRIKLQVSLNKSNLVLTTESATKIYKSKKEYGINYINIKLQKCANLEFINDELILYEQSKYIQLFRLTFDESCTFFYTDILSRGRSYENFDFTSMLMKNSFYENKNLEYQEKFDVSGVQLKDYMKRKKSKQNFFAKLYIKTNNNEEFLNEVYKSGFESITYSSNQKMLIAVISHDNMNSLRKEIFFIWSLYRKSLNKKEFNLGKQ